eukprot:9580567-Alexandrium_andersonii.AAC.1
MGASCWLTPHKGGREPRPRRRMCWHRISWGRRSGHQSAENEAGTGAVPAKGWEIYLSLIHI